MNYSEEDLRRMDAWQALGRASAYVVENVPLEDQEAIINAMLSFADEEKESCTIKFVFITLLKEVYESSLFFCTPFLTINKIYNNY